jgi:hypothetical protein
VPVRGNEIGRQTSDAFPVSLDHAPVHRATRGAALRGVAGDERRAQRLGQRGVGRIVRAQGVAQRPDPGQQGR